MEVGVRCHKPFSKEHLDWGEYVENNGFVCIHAIEFKDRHRGNSCRLKDLFDLGYTDAAIEAIHVPENRDSTCSLNADSIKKNATRVVYSFNNYTSAAPKLTVYTIPGHPLNNNFSLRCGVSVDEGPVYIVDFKTEGRSEEWKENVLRNRAERTIQLPQLNKGHHSLKIYFIDPGVILDEVRIDFGGLKKAYSAIPATITSNWRYRY